MVLTLAEFKEREKYRKKQNKRMQRMERNIEKILDALIGTGEFGSDGVISRLEAIEKKVKTLEKTDYKQKTLINFFKIDSFLGIIAIVVVLAPIIIEQIKSLL